MVKTGKQHIESLDDDRAIFIDGPKSYFRGWLYLHMPKTFSVLKALWGRV